MKGTYTFLCVLIIVLLGVARDGPFAVNSALASNSEEAGQTSDKAAGAIGYGGPRLRLSPLMVPVHNANGVSYAPLVVQLALGGGNGPEGLPTEGDIKTKQACFSIPFIHEQLLFYLYKANLKSEDMRPDHYDVLAGNLFGVVQRFMGKGYFTGVEIVDENTPPLEPKSQTMSVQCR